MEGSLLNIGLGFLEGFGLIISPCILPILPIILSGSIEGSKKRPLGIICGFVIVFALFTFFSRKLVQISGINLNAVRHIAFVILFLLGLIMISSTLTEIFSRLTQRLANFGAKSSMLNNPQGGFLSGILFGSLVALIWTPCAGPILAAVIVQTVIQKTSLSSFFVLLAFALGAIIPMLVIAIFGRIIMAKLSFLKHNTGLIRKLLGVIIIASVAWMAYSEVYAATPVVAKANPVAVTPPAVPAAAPVAAPATATLTVTPAKNMATFPLVLIDGLAKPYPAPPLVGITSWINSTPLTLSDLKGKVVLIDFWTYSCINCMRTLPYLKDWYGKYHDKGLVIIGVHTPEFDFEKDLSNVTAAVQANGIMYPVALDNNYSTWLNYHNKYWPAHYLIDKNGNVVYEHFGEGSYDITENNIRFLLGLNKPIQPTSIPQNPTNRDETPETYLGLMRAKTFSSPEAAINKQIQHYSFPIVLAQNSWALGGDWWMSPEFIVSAGKDVALKIHFHAKKVFAVMGMENNKTIPVKVLLNGEFVITNKGKDVNNSTIQVSKHALYELLSFDSPQDGILELAVPNEGLELYTFTFGN